VRDGFDDDVDARLTRIEVGEGEDRCEIDLAVDYRALLVETGRYGPTLAIEELAANMVLAPLRPGRGA
jgi:hypothetical protein